MGFPARPLIQRDALQNVLEQMATAAYSIHQEAFSLRDRAMSPPVTWQKIFDTCDEIAKECALVDALSQTPGLAQYVRDNLQDQAKDIRADFQAMRSACDLVINFIVNNQGSPQALSTGDGGDGLVRGEIDVLDTGAQDLTALVNRLNGLLATIDVS